MGMGPVIKNSDKRARRAEIEAFEQMMQQTRAQRLQPEPAGGPPRQSPFGGPTQGATLALNQMNNPNTNRIMPSTGGRTYTANPFASQQGRIGPTGQGAIMPRPANPGLTNPNFIPPGKMPPSRIPGGAMMMGGGGGLRNNPIVQSGGTGLPGFGNTPLPGQNVGTVPLRAAPRTPTVTSPNQPQVASGQMSPQAMQQMAQAQAMRGYRGRTQ